MRSIYIVGAESTGWTEVNLYSSCIIHERRYDGGFFGQISYGEFRVVYRVSMGGCLMRQQRKRTIWNTVVSILGRRSVSKKKKKNLRFGYSTFLWYG